ncbi:protein-S-isoprenylcysteine O-methyltransferase B-like isoform X1 [Vigna unguiculata]|uniref:protein-S-isoprenylcysteine O-methyltransferase B-like isoform X1 n=1 Tax=Vigna unguiculata TaxID=3917 RepID=UPI001015F6E1|nr:protein-S-isoprenylcysteine O-methyltransferase B-like isoform X1 [Vigna unguiculata]
MVHFLPGCDSNISDKMPYLKHFLGDGIEFPILILHYKLHFSEILSYTACRQLSQMFFAIVFFHSSEYFLAAIIHGRSNITLRSLLLSKHYVLAMIFSVLEYSIEIVLVPEMKEHWVISDLGLALVVIGEIIRKMGILTAWKAFTHLIKIYHDNDHKLITHGIYGYIRHPGYCGFLVWSVGTQIMLCNPISTIAFAAVVWRFFAKRIPYEEFFLRQFFGREYERYAQRVGSGVPFVK